MCLSKYLDEFGIAGSLHVRHSREIKELETFLRS